MAKQETNFLEILFRNLMIGMTVHDDDGTPLVIDELNYDPMIGCIYITSEGNSHKMRLDRNYDFVMDANFNKIAPNKKRIKGKRDR